MHKDLYASGFLFHPPSQQILLQRKNSSSDTPVEWCLLDKAASNNKALEKAFREVVFQNLGVKLNIAKVFFVYSYLNKDTGNTHHIFYGEIEKINDFPPRKHTTFNWFSTKQIQKLPLAPQTKQDITVSQRVIDSKIRKSLGERTIE